MTYLCFSKDEGCQKNIRGITTFNILIIVGFFVLLSLFLIQNSSLVGKNYQLRQYQNIISQKQEAQEKLEIKKIESDSLATLQEAAKNFNLVNIDTIKYLENTESSMALFNGLNR